MYREAPYQNKSLDELAEIHDMYLFAVFNCINNKVDRHPKGGSNALDAYLLLSHSGTRVINAGKGGEMSRCENIWENTTSVNCINYSI